MSVKDRTAVVLIAHGTVEDLADLPAFLANIRRGHPPPPELIAEVRRRYEAIGGRSPLTDISRSLAHKVEAVLGLPVRLAMRLFAPFPKEVLTALAKEGRDHIAVVPLAQHSAKIYVASVADAAAELAKEDTSGRTTFTVRGAENWGRTPSLNAAFEGAAREALLAAGATSAEEVANTTLLFTAHSLPKFIIDAGDPYDVEVREAAREVGARLTASPAFAGLDVRVCYQSQGMSQPSRDGKPQRPQEWLGPDLKEALADIARSGKKRVVVAPIGFLADHVEILYDLDIEAMGWAKELSLSFSRTRSLDDSEPMVRAITDVARVVLAELGAA